jgi:GNAT superfamily N-acetyltransferase
MEDLYVTPRARGTGVADRLIEACAARAREAGVSYMTWLTATDNRRAQAVYARTGAGAGAFLEYELPLDDR